MTPDNRTAICPGTYDPVTNGHLDVIRRAAGMFDKLVVGVVNHPIRKDRTLFGVEERVAFIEEATAAMGNVSVASFSTLLVDFARHCGARAIVKGLRAISDFEYEFEMNQLNRDLDSEIESVYLMAAPQYSFIRSSGIKELATFGAEIEHLVPPRVAKRLKEELQR